MNLAYTWYFNDWQASQNVRRLTLPEKAVYRELIDLYYKEDSKLVFDEFWVDDFAYMNRSTPEEINKILDRLMAIGLIIIEGNSMQIPSCDRRFEIINRNRENGKKNRKSTQIEPRLDPDLTQIEPRLDPELSNSEGKLKQKLKLKQKDKQNAPDQTSESLEKSFYFFDISGEYVYRKKLFKEGCMLFTQKFGASLMNDFYYHFSKKKVNTDYMLCETIKNWDWEKQINAFKTKNGKEV